MWIRSLIPNVFYITEKATNFYPYTTTGKSSSLRRHSIRLSVLLADQRKISSFAFLLCIEYTVSVDLTFVACSFRFEEISLCGRERGL